MVYQYQNFLNLLSTREKSEIPFKVFGICNSLWQSFVQRFGEEGRTYSRNKRNDEEDQERYVESIFTLQQKYKREH